MFTKPKKIHKFRTLLQHAILRLSQQLLQLHNSTCDEVTIAIIPSLPFDTKQIFSEMNKTPVLPVKTGLWPQPPSPSPLWGHLGGVRVQHASRCAPLMLPVTTAILSIKICSERIIIIIVQYTAFLIYIIVIHKEKIC